MELLRALVWIFSVLVLLLASLILYPTIEMLVFVTLSSALLTVFQTFLILKAKE